MRRIMAVLTVAVSLGLVGCSDDGPSTRILGPEEQAFNTHVRALSDIIQEAPKEPEVINSSTNPTPPPEGNDYRIITTTYSAAVGFSEILALDPTTDVIWPGALINGDTIRNGTYAPITAYRQPLTISISLVNLQGNRSVTMADPKLSTYRDAIATLLQQEMSGPSAARISFTMEEVSSAAQLAIALGAKFDSSLAPVNVSGNFEFGSSTSNTCILVKFLQVYYTVDIDIPVQPTDFFAPDNDWSWLQSQMSNTSPMYVSSISYGRMALFSIQSSQSATRVKAALSASFEAAKVGNIEANVSIEHQNTLNQCTIKAFIIGGNGVDAVNLINGFDSFKTYLVNGANYSSETPAAPISYKLRYLKDNRIGDIVLSSEYTVAKSVRISNVDRFKVTGLKLLCDTEDDAGDNAEFFGKIRVTAFTVTNVTNVTSQVDGYRDGYPSNGILWDIPRDQSENWALPAGGSKNIDSEIYFTFDHSVSPQNSLIRVEGELYEDDGFWGGYRYMGTFSRTVSLQSYMDNTNASYTVNNFAVGGTQARVQFSIAPY